MEVLQVPRQKVINRGEAGHEWRGVVFLASFLAVFVVQMLAPFPYEDYQVPIMGLLAIFAAVNFIGEVGAKDKSETWKPLLVVGLVFATSFGSPLLEKWMVYGQDRFWSVKKEQSELAQLREVAREINRLDPDGKDILTQDTYLAVETNRKVPHGLEMGPFSILSDNEWRALLTSAPCRVAATSGYTFSIMPPSCVERPKAEQLEYTRLLEEHYTQALYYPRFGQNATELKVYLRQ